MKLHLIPAADDRLEEVVVTAVGRAHVDLGDAPPAYRSPWRDAALVEGVERMPRLAEGYTLSPRRTRGATRA